MSAARVLVVDDDAVIRTIVKRALETLGGHTVLALSSGHQAVQSAPTFMPHLMILDVSMPVLDGPETLKALRAQPGLDKVPAVFLTGHTRASDVGRYRMLGVVDVVAKPFRPQLLCQRVNAALARASAAVAAPARGPGALVIEDDPGIRYLLRFILAQQGYRVAEAHDGTQGLAALSDGPLADLVLLDIMLPGIDGLRLLELLREMPRWNSAKVLMLSGNGGESSVQRALVSGADEYLVKPFDPAELVARLERLRSRPRVAHNP